MRIEKFSKFQKNIISQTPVKDILTIPQNGEILDLIKQPLIPYKLKNFKEYKKNFFSVWHQNNLTISKEDLTKSFDIIPKKFNSNFEVYQEDNIQNLLDNGNIESLGKLNIKAIIIENTNLRTMPTKKPAFYDVEIAGEGYPFDNLCNSALHIGEPILLSHYTKDRKWAFVETNSKAYGFVYVKDLALVNEELAKYITNSRFVTILKDDLNLYNDGNYFNSLKFGSFIIYENGHLALPVKQNNNYAKFIKTKIDESNISHFPLAFNKDNVSRAINQLINKPYGWGGYGNDRDCAQIIKDYFAIFGIHTPIFSGNQIKLGNIINLKGLTNSEKLLKIQNEAIPYQTVLFRKGHITIYLGEYNKTPLMFHSVWGVHLFNEYDIEFRHIIGGSAITSLEYGKELEGYIDNESNFLSLMTHMSIY